jgi:hypothetical protein
MRRPGLSKHSLRESDSQLAIQLRDEGVMQTDVYFLFEHFQKQTPACDPLYDAIVDTMDEIHGGSWSKGDGLFPTPLTDVIIQAARKKD